MEQVVKLSATQLKKLQEIQEKRQILNDREGDILEIALETAKIKTPVVSIKLVGDSLLIEDGKEVPKEKVTKKRD